MARHRWNDEGLKKLWKDNAHDFDKTWKASGIRRGQLQWRLEQLGLVQKGTTLPTTTAQQNAAATTATLSKVAQVVTGKTVAAIVKETAEAEMVAAEPSKTEVKRVVTVIEPPEPLPAEFVHLSAYVPKTKVNYIHRGIDDEIDFWADPKAWTDTVAQSLLLIGEASCGKTEAVIEYARRHSLPLLVVPCDESMVLKELLGQTTAADGTTTWKDGLLSQMLQIPAVVLFDEVNMLSGARLAMLHELLQNRRLFVKDAPAEKALVNVHPKCRIFLAMNPPTAAYTGTSRLNCALATRLVTLELEPFTVDQLNVKTGNEQTDKLLVKFFSDVQNAISQQKLRVVFCKRNVDRIVNALKRGAKIRQALLAGFINSSLTTATSTERNALLDVARYTFGTSIDEK